MQGRVRTYVGAAALGGAAPLQAHMLISHRQTALCTSHAAVAEQLCRAAPAIEAGRGGRTFHMLQPVKPQEVKLRLAPRVCTSAGSVALAQAWQQPWAESAMNASCVAV